MKTCKHTPFSVFLILFLFVNSLIGYSQSYGIKAGINYSYVKPYQLMSEDEPGTTPEYEPKLGFHIGITKDIKICNYFSFQPEILFTTKGFKGSWQDYYNNNWKSNVSLSYLEFPLNLKYYINIGKIKAYILGGPFISFGVKALTTSILTDRVTKEERVYIYRGFSSNLIPFGDMGINANLGISYNKFNYELRYQVGSICCIKPDFPNMRLLSLSLEYKL